MPSTIATLAAIEDADTRRVVDAERAFLSELGGDCDLPAGAHAVTTADGEVEMEGMLSSLDGRVLIRERRVGDDPDMLGRSIARHLSTMPAAAPFWPYLDDGRFAPSVAGRRNPPARAGCVAR